MVPASTFTYGSILIAVTFKPRDCKIFPIDETVIPFPTPDMTPPTTKIYLRFFFFFIVILNIFYTLCYTLHIKVSSHRKKTGDRSQNNSRYQNNTRYFKKIVHVVLKYVDTTKKRFGIILKPKRDGIEKPDGNNRRDNAVENPLNNERTADVAVVRTHEPHDTNLFARRINSESDGIERNKNRNNNEDNSDNCAQLLDSSNDRG